MNRWIASFVVIACWTASTQAHFVWILPGEGGQAAIVFSDALAPDDAVPVAKISKTELFLRGSDGQKVKVKAAEGKQAYAAAIDGKGSQVLAGVTPYGVLQRGKDEPFLLTYHSKAIVGWPPSAECCQPWHALGLEVVPIAEGVGAKFQVAGVRVYWQGNPLPEAEIVVLGGKEPIEGKTDRQGFFQEGFGMLTRPGLVGVRVAHKEAKAGEHDGKKYAEKRHYATLVWAVPEQGKEKAQPAADPQATKLLADARAARANWAKFPGFRADLEVNFSGKTEKGKVEVNADGKVTVTLADKDALPWVKRQLASLVGHRLDDGTERATPCAFLDGVRDHPMGRAIRVLNDELHSSYRIRDRQILEVNRVTGDERFTITVMENLVNAEKKFLPVSYVVNTWNTKTGDLARSQAFHHAWQRLGGFDLPTRVTVVDTTAARQPGTTGALDVRTLTLSNHKLLK